MKSNTHWQRPYAHQRCFLASLTRVATVLLSLACVAVSPAGTNDFIAGYHLDAHVLLLDESLRGPDGALKPFKDLAPGEIATLYHELWHAWFIRGRRQAKGRGLSPVR